jgi:lipid-A-disaccharide synthase
LIAGKTVVKELFGKDFSVRKIREELDLLLHDESYRQEMQANYELILERLETPGASARAAQIVDNSI